MGKKTVGQESVAVEGGHKGPETPQQAARVVRLKEMIRKGEYDTQEKIDAILEGFIKDLL